MHRREELVKNGLVQCAVGMEVEVPDYLLYRNHLQLREHFKDEKVNHPYSFSMPKFKDREILMKGDGFTLQSDSSHHTHQMPYLEIVTEPFPETKEGFLRLRKVFDDIASLMRLIDEKKDSFQNYIPFSLFRSLGEIPTHFQVAFISANRPAQGIFQATVGIRNDRLFNFFDEVTSARRSDFVEAAARKYVKASWIFADQQGWACGHVGFLKKQFEVVEEVERMTGRAWSDSLKGLMAQIVFYLVVADFPIMAYPKSFAVFLARTDLASQFDLLPQTEREMLLADDAKKWKEWVNMLAGRCGILSLDLPFFAQGVYRGVPHVAWHNIMKSLTRRDWLENIPKGKDLLTEKHFPNRFRAYKLDSLGAFGSKTDPVGKDGAHKGVILELRTTNKRYRYEEWKVVAETYFQLVYAHNHDLPYELGDELQELQEE
ncbi:MAG: hypothetical protein MI784_14340 [Cytophagales bacterium]|nr:hypothetical protein [Cytophagales bacterium]